MAANRLIRTNPRPPRTLPNHDRALLFAARGGEGLRSELDEKLLGFAARLARSRSPAHVLPVGLHVPGGGVVTFIHARMRSNSA